MGVTYQHGSFRLRNLLQVYGSVFPYVVCPAIFCGTLAALLKYLALLESTLDEYLGRPMTNNVGFTAYTVFVGFLVTFRTSKAYDRFWNGANYIKKMQAEYFVTASNLTAFCRHSSDLESKSKFQHTLIRLLSLLHGVSLHQLAAGGDGVDIAKQPLPRFELVDVRGLDFDSLRVLVHEECRVELIIQWIQSLTVDGIKSGVCTIPPPILSRIFQNLSNALTAYYSAYRVTEVPYPFPYVQTTEVILLVHMIVTPVVMQSFTSNYIWAFVCSFFAVFLILSLNFIAAELENPFSDTINVLNMKALQHEFNKRLLLLIKSTTNKVPSLSESCMMEQVKLPYLVASLAEVFDEGAGAPRTAECNKACDDSHHYASAADANSTGEALKLASAAVDLPPRAMAPLPKASLASAVLTIDRAAERGTRPAPNSSVERLMSPSSDAAEAAIGCGHRASDALVDKECESESLAMLEHHWILSTSEPAARV
eukprot:TRINITY_DN11854_c0_g1_i2.p1 TRINITY_DN11854_c0_g1~~TRINITY_DN11854_c0_g1_i2.p1  ORF type:complete len:482 (-),score=55.09 TRINITY_DN11854_c0_g1_i2:222-1667(-)